MKRKKYNETKVMKETVISKLFLPPYRFFCCIVSIILHRSNKKRESTTLYSDADLICYDSCKKVLHLNVSFSLNEHQIIFL